MSGEERFPPGLKNLPALKIFLPLRIGGWREEDWVGKAIFRTKPLPRDTTGDQPPAERPAHLADPSPVPRPPEVHALPILRFPDGDPLPCFLPRGPSFFFRFFRAAKAAGALPRQDEAAEHPSLGARPPLDRRSASRFSSVGDRRDDPLEPVGQPGLRRGGSGRRPRAPELHRGTYRLKYLSLVYVAPPDQSFFKRHSPGLASLPLHHAHRGRTSHRGRRVGSNCHLMTLGDSLIALQFKLK